jgi:hypothetical protein
VSRRLKIKELPPWGVGIICVAFAGLIATLPHLSTWPILFFLAVAILGMLVVLSESLCYAVFHRVLPIDTQGSTFAAISGIETVATAVGFGTSGVLGRVVGIDVASQVIAGAGMVLVGGTLMIARSTWQLNSPSVSVH